MYSYIETEVHGVLLNIIIWSMFDISSQLVAGCVKMEESWMLEHAHVSVQMATVGLTVKVSSYIH